MAENAQESPCRNIPSITDASAQKPQSGGSPAPLGPVVAFGPQEFLIQPPSRGPV